MSKTDPAATNAAVSSVADGGAPALQRLGATPGSGPIIGYPLGKH